MVDNTNSEAAAAVEAPVKAAEPVADTGKVAADAPQKAVKPARRKRVAASAKGAKRAVRKTKTAARKTVRAANEGIETMNNNFFSGFQAAPAFAPFQSLFADANERSQELAKRSQKVAEEIADLARANVEAVVEAGRVAAEGARSLGQDIVANSRDNVEQAAGVIRTLAEAKSPTEYLQVQGDFARASFDRAVAESSKLTESLVKLAGQAFQPLSNRATANVERFNSLVA